MNPYDYFPDFQLVPDKKDDEKTPTMFEQEPPLQYCSNTIKCYVCGSYFDKSRITADDIIILQLGITTVGKQRFQWSINLHKECWLYYVKGNIKGPYEP